MVAVVAGEQQQQNCYLSSNHLHQQHGQLAGLPSIHHLMAYV
jgi:hypothetical protein